MIENIDHRHNDPYHDGNNNLCPFCVSNHCTDRILIERFVFFSKWLFGSISKTIVAKLLAQAIDYQKSLLLLFLTIVSILPQSLSNDDPIPWTAYQCNLTNFPRSRGCHPSNSRCDDRSNLCICFNNTMEQSDYLSNERNHYKPRCLMPRQLGQSCLHSSQCYAMTLGSRCLRDSKSYDIIDSRNIDIEITPSNHSIIQIRAKDDKNIWKCSCGLHSKGIFVVRAFN